MDSTDYDSGGEDDFKDKDDSRGFAIGTVVFPVEKVEDFVDPQSVLVNHVDTYIGKFLGEYLSNKGVGALLDGESEFEGEFDGEGSITGGEKFWKVLGTFKSNGSQIPPWLWAVMKTDDYDAYMKEIMKCNAVIYDITDDPSPARFDEIRAVCDAMRERVPTFRTRRVFILISSLHSWTHTLPPNEDENAYLSESDYRRRRTKQAYRDLQLLERYVVASGKMTRGMLKAYVIGAGAVYGAGEGPLHHWFKTAWHNAKYLPLYGSGKNFLPTIYIKDLASIIQHVLDTTPKKQRYILAVDPTICQQDQIVKAISTMLGTGTIKRVPETDIYLNRELTTFQADQLLLDFKIETTFCKDNFDIGFYAKEGLSAVIQKISLEFKKHRKLEPLKICILGPPAVGKSTVCRQISDIYRLNHFTKEDMVTSTIELLRETAGDQPEPDIEGLDMSVEEEIRQKAKRLLAEVDEALSLDVAKPKDHDNEEETEGEHDGEEIQHTRKDDSQLKDEIVAKLFRYRLLTNQCQNQGFVLDGYPETLKQAKLLFMAGSDDGEFYGEEAGEDGKDPLDPRIVPDKVFVLEAPDEFLTNRLLSISTSELAERHLDINYPGLLAEYRGMMERYDSTCMYYMDLQEMLYFPIDISTDSSTMLLSTIGRISDLLGRPRNYGLTVDEENALKNNQQLEKQVTAETELEDMAHIESKELEERRTNIQQWMEKLAMIKREEFEREEAALIPLRHYLMAHVVPTLTKGLVEVTRARPTDPVEFLAEFMFQHNPGSINNINAQKFREEMKK